MLVGNVKKKKKHMIALYVLVYSEHQNGLLSEKKIRKHMGYILHYILYLCSSLCKEGQYIHVLTCTCSGTMHKKSQLPLGGGLGSDVEGDILLSSHQTILCYLKLCYHEQTIIFLSTAFKY